LTQPDDIFFDLKEKIEKSGIFRENLSNSELADPTRPEQQKMSRLRSKMFDPDPSLIFFNDALQ